MENSHKKKSRVGLLIFALTFLINPTVKVIDVLPDFIACFIIAKYLEYPSIRVPYFEEARLDFLKLGFLSLFKLPAYYLITFAKSNNVQDYDTGVLVTLVFTVIEVILLLSAVNHLFSALFYLGERSDATAMITKFPLDKKNFKFMTPEGLKTLTIAFIIIKNAACLLPEMLLLTQSVDPGIYVQAFRPMKYYPYAIILAVIGAFVFSIIYAKRACAFIRAVGREGKFLSAVDSIAAEGIDGETAKKETVRAVKRTLTLFTLASALTFELCFDNFGGINLLPHFLYGAVLLFALVSARKHTKVMPSAYVFTSLFTAASAVAYFINIDFVDTYGYSALTKNSSAKDMYLPVIISSLIEFALLMISLILIANVILKIIVNHTGTEKNSLSYSKPDKHYERKTVTNVVLVTAFAIVAAASKALEVIFRYFSSLEFVALDDGISGVVSGFLPWFGTVTFATALIYFGFTLYFFSNVKEDVDMKYA